MVTRKLRSAAHTAAALATIMTVLQPLALGMEPAPATGELAMRVTDVSLGTNGVLFGQLVDRQGRQLPIAEIQITNGVRNWTAYTDNEGNFHVEGLVGSTYQVQAAGQTHIVRAWAPGTAPPQAAQGVLMVYDGAVVAGQHCGSPVCNRIAGAKHPLSNPFIFGGLVAAAIAIPVAIHNHDEDDQPAEP